MTDYGNQAWMSGNKITKKSKGSSYSGVTTDYKLYQLGAYHMIGDDDYEPQRQTNFELHIYLDGGDNGKDLRTVHRNIPIPNTEAQQTLTLSVRSVGSITTNVEPIEVPYGNTKVKFAGLPNVQNTSIVFSDYLGKATERILAAWHGQVFNPNSQAVGKATTYKKTAVLIETAPDGSNGRAWRLLGLWPSNLEYGSYDYSSAATRNITCTFTYDIALPLD